MSDDFGKVGFTISPEYKVFRDVTGHITNFNPADEHIYVKAIQQYKEAVCAEADMYVGEGSKGGSSRGFYVRFPKGDLGPFWQAGRRARSTT